MTAREHRVVWQRQGMRRPHTRLYQTLGGARRFALTLQGRVVEATGRRASDLYCCGGNDCSCGGYTIAEMAQLDHERVPPLILGPVIESRPVGGWTEVYRANPDTQEPWDERKLWEER